MKLCMWMLQTLFLVTLSLKLKSLFVYRHEGYESHVSVTSEHNTLHNYQFETRGVQSNQTLLSKPPTYDSYGFSEVTSKVYFLVRYEHLDVLASNDVSSDS